MKKFFIGLFVTLVSISTTFAIIQKTNVSVLEVSQKRSVYTDTGLPSGNYIVDINSGGKVIMYGSLVDSGDNKYIGGTGINYSDNILNLGKNQGGYSLGDMDKIFTGDYNIIRSGYNNECSNQTIINVSPSSLPQYYETNTIYKFEKNVYFLNTGIELTGQCTYLIAERGADIIGSSNISGQVIYVSGKYNVIKGLEINAATKEGIYINGFSGNTIKDVQIYNANRGIMISGSHYNLINNSKIYSNTIGIGLYNSSDNIINSILSFNNTQNGVYISGGYRNTTNNAAIFNNAAYGYAIRSGTYNVINNSMTYNNTSFGIRLISGNYMHQVRTLNNNNDNYALTTTGYGSIVTSWTSFSAVNLKLGTPYDYLVSGLNRNTGFVTTGYQITKDDTIIPYDNIGNALFDVSQITGNRRGNKTFVGKISNIEIGSKVFQNISAVTFNIARDRIININVGSDGIIGEDPIGDYWYIVNNSLGELSIKKKNYTSLTLNASGAYTIGRQKLMTSSDVLSFLGNYIQWASVSTLPGTSNTLLMTQKAITDYVDNNTFFKLVDSENIESDNYSFGLKMCGHFNQYSGYKNLCLASSMTNSGNLNLLLGNLNINYGDYNIIQGSTNYISGNQNLLIGQGSSVTGDNSIIIGNGGNILGKNNAIIGGEKIFDRNIQGQNSSIIGGSMSNVYGTNSSSIGGISNFTQGNSSSILGGESNVTASGKNYQTIVGGNSNSVDGLNSAALGTSIGKIAGDRSTIVGGNTNSITGNSNIILGGTSNIISGGSTSIAQGSSNKIFGGIANSIGGSSSTISGGNYNFVQGRNLLVNGSNNVALGYNVSINNDGVFAFSDNYFSHSPSYLSSTKSYTFLVRAKNGVGINTPSPITGMSLDVKGSGNFDGWTFFGNYNSGHYTSFDASGFMQSYGDSIVWNDIQPELYEGSITQNKPTYSMLTGGVIEQRCFDDAKITELFGRFEKPHNATDTGWISPHLHRTPNIASNGTGIIQFTYQFIEPNKLPTAPITITGFLNAGGVAWSGLIRDIGGDIYDSGIALGGSMVFRIWRDANLAGDTYTGSMCFQQVGLHYMSDRRGSRTEYTR